MDFDRPCSPAHPDCTSPDLFLAQPSLPPVDGEMRNLKRQRGAQATELKGETAGIVARYLPLLEDEAAR